MPTNFVDITVGRLANVRRGELCGSSLPDRVSNYDLRLRPSATAPSNPRPTSVTVVGSGTVVRDTSSKSTVADWAGIAGPAPWKKIVADVAVAGAVTEVLNKAYVLAPGVKLW